MHDDPLLTPRAAAKRLGRNVETIRRWIRSGYLPVVSPGPRRYLIRARDVDKMLEARTLVKKIHDTSLQITTQHHRTRHSAG
jgi:excisionase family DNA binding protein